MITREGIRKTFRDWTHPRPPATGQTLNDEIQKALDAGPMREKKDNVEILKKTAFLRLKFKDGTEENLNQLIARIGIGLYELNSWPREKIAERAAQAAKNAENEIGEPKRPSFFLKQEPDQSLPRFVITD